jgi:hypothetical protein
MQNLHCHYPPSCRSYRIRAALPFAVLVAGMALVAGCGTEAPADWQWWTNADSAAARTELATWRGVLSSIPALSDTLRLNLSVPLSHEDSISTSGATLYKFAHLISAWAAPAESGLALEYHFGPSVDTIAMTDTFCQVAYRDTLAGSKYHFLYDSLWKVTFRPDTQPDSTVVFRVSSTELVGFAAPSETTKTYDWSASRQVFMPKDTASTEPKYGLTRVTGVAAYVPTAQDAPAIDYVVFSKPGQVDTFSLVQSRWEQHLYRLRPLDSLYTLFQDEQMTMTVTTTTPVDTSTDKNRFFMVIAGHKSDITAAARRAGATVSFSDTGYQHVYIEVLPLSNLLYKDAAFKSTVWAIPVRVEARQP